MQLLKKITSSSSVKSWVISALPYLVKHDAVSNIPSFDELKNKQHHLQTFGAPYITFSLAAIALAAKVSVIDGELHPKEKEIFLSRFSSLAGLDDSPLTLFQAACVDNTDSRHYAKTAALAYPSNVILLSELMKTLIHLAECDHPINDLEYRILHKIALGMGFNDYQFKKIIEHYFYHDTTDPYTLLGVAKKTSKNEIKKAYRSAIQQCHPDLISHHKVADEIRTQLDIKFKKLTAAYQSLQ